MIRSLETLDLKMDTVRRTRKPRNESYLKRCSAAVRNAARLLRCRVGAPAILFVILFAMTGSAANWYVDNAATGSKNGASWANAWTSFAQVVWGASGVKAGDTLYISGGSSSKVYTETWIVGASGTAANPITIAVDAANPSHNGTVVFDYASQGTSSGSDYAIRVAQQYVVFDGNVNGTSHFVVQNMRNILTRTKCRAFYCSGGDKLTFRYLTVTNCNNGISTGCRLVENCRFLKMAGDYSIDATHNSVQNWDQIIIRQNFIESAYNTAVAPGGSGNWTGPDGVWADNGVTVYSNVFKCTAVSYYTSNQHTDYIQATGNYIRVYANEFINIGDSAFDYDCYANANPHDVWIYNNLFRITDSLDSYPEYFRLYASMNSISSIQNFKILNNTFVDSDATYRVIRFDMFNASPTASGNEIKNNLFYGCGGGGANSPIIYVEDSSGFNTSSFSFDANIYYNPSQQYNVYRGTAYTTPNWVSSFEPKGKTSKPALTSYTYHGVNNNYHLLATDTAARDAGLNESAFFAVDKDGGARPQGAAWDIGAYEYGSGGAATNPVISVTPASLNFSTLATGTTGDLAITVKNSGAGVLAGSASVAAPFSVISGGTYNLGSNASQTVMVRYAPTVAGTHTQTIAFTGGGGLALTVSGSAYAPMSGMSFESEAGQLAAPFVAAGGSISQPVETGVTSGGRASYGFTITNAGLYAVQFMINAPSDAGNSIFWNIDAEPEDPAMIWDIPVTSGFELLLGGWRGAGTFDNNEFVPKVFNLSPGTHQLIIRGREPNVQIDRLAIIGAPNPPTNIRVISSP